MNEDKMSALFIGWFLFVALLSVTAVGVGIWALVELVQWLTTK
jgi:hypothetical protein